jgi:hypothetical protein
MGVAAPGVVEQAAARQPTQAEAIRANVSKKFTEQKNAHVQIREKKVDLTVPPGKKRGEVVREVVVAMGKEANWQDNKTTRAFVEGAIDFHADVQKKVTTLLNQAKKTGVPITPEEAQAQAERLVLNARIRNEQKAARQKNSATTEVAKPSVPATETVAAETTAAGEDAVVAAEMPLTAEQAAEQEKARLAQEAEKANMQIVADATKAWAERGASGDEARSVLELIAAQKGVDAATARLGRLADTFKDAKTEQQKELVRSQYARAELILEKAQESLTKMSNANEKLMRDPKTPIEARLLGYDIKMAQTAQTLNEAQLQVHRLNIKLGITPDAEKAAVLEEINKAKVIVDNITKESKDLAAERAKVGSPEQQQVKYIAAEVMTLTNGLELATGETEEQRSDAILKDPLSYLQEQIENRESGMLTILENSNISVADQKKILAIADAKAAERAVSQDEIKNKIKIGGRQGLLAMLILLYTANMTNKKVKNGGAMQ